MTRRELIAKHPPPYHLCVLGANKKVLARTKHNTLSSLELEVEVARAKIRDDKDPASDYTILEVPKELVLGKFDARAEMVKERVNA